LTATDVTHADATISASAAAVGVRRVDVTARAAAASSRPAGISRIRVQSVKTGSKKP
jgi:hypothetical protein